MKPKTFYCVEDLNEWIRKYGSGKVLDVSVLHDDWCQHGTTYGCTCNPCFIVQKATGKSIADGVSAERRWLDRHRNN